MGAIFEQAGIPLLLFVLCMYYGIRMIILKDASVIRGKNVYPLRDEKEYAEKGGILLILLGIGSLLMGILTLVNVYVAFAEILICIIIVGILWKKMNAKYGVQE